MASLSWYVQRAAAMGPRELLWRTRNAVRDRTDRLLLPLRQHRLTWSPEGGSLVGRGVGIPSWCNGSDVPAAEYPARWRQRLLTRAGEICENRLSFFDRDGVHLGEPIDWNRDHKAGIACPLSFAAKIDYRDFAEVGDCKFVWEPSRHHQWVVLGRAYRLTGETRFAQAAARQMQSWLEQCPFGCGMQWRSPLELGVRMINWATACELLHPAGVFGGPLGERLAEAAYRHVWEIARKYSYGSSANNHLVGEAAGVFVAASAWPHLPHARRYRKEAREILEREILLQTHGDGGTREQAMGYHLFSLQLFLLPAMVAEANGASFSEAYWNRLEKMFEFLAAFAEGGPLPLFGDADDGYVLDLGDGPRDVREWLAVAAVRWERKDFARLAGEFSETAWWLLGPEARTDFDALRTDDGGYSGLRSRALEASGHYLLQCGRGEDRLSVAFDCGPLGMGSLAAHGHADALSFTLRAFGQHVLVDSGTYDYFSYPRWRRYFRGTRAHNTVVIDGQDQSVQRGLFLWGRRAEATLAHWQASPVGGGTVAGSHDGYTRLTDPVIHTRKIVLDATTRSLTVIDMLDGDGEHDVEVMFHVGPDCEVSRQGERLFAIDVPGGGRVELAFDATLSCELICGCEDEPLGGWFSSGYHRKAPATTLVGRCRMSGPLRLASRIAIRSSVALEAAGCVGITGGGGS